MSSTDCTTTIVHRPLGGLEGLRTVTDRASRVSVMTFPISLAQSVCGAGLLNSPGAYILAGAVSAYIGESGRPARRIMQHVGDPTKSFGTEAYVVSGCEGSPFDTVQIIDLQYRLTALALEMGAVTVLKGTGPQEPFVNESDRTTHNRIFADTRRLLYDAGCRLLCPPQPEPSQVMPDAMSDGADSGPMEIGVSTTPPGAVEYEINYYDLWARGYWASNHFVVAAGSEIRSVANESTNAITLARRDELSSAGALEDIPGVNDRRRLRTAVAFPSMSIAAKSVCGAHTSAQRWVPLNKSRPILLTS